MEDLFKVGTISSTHGIKGEVKVYSTTEDLSKFSQLKQLILYTGESYINLEIEGVKYFKNQAILKFKGIDNINDIEKYKGKDLFVSRENAEKLKEDEYYVADLIGSSVISDKGDELGQLTEVIKTGANDVYVVTASDGKEILLPVIRECILNIDVDKQIIKVHLMDGLI